MEKEQTRKKRKPGGQLGHTGTTRKGFGRIDRSEVLKAEKCLSCGQSLTKAKSIKIEKQSVAVLVERPCNVVEYQRHHSLCECCGTIIVILNNNETLKYTIIANNIIKSTVRRSIHSSSL